MLINRWRFVLPMPGSVRESKALLMVVGSIIISGKDHYMPWVKMIENLVILKCLTQKINQMEKSLKQQLRLKYDFVKLTSIDGIGLILALTIMLETGDISRFNKVGKFASYCRYVNGGRYSNVKKKSKTNTKKGNKYLTWAFIEAANFAIRFNDTIKRYYQRKLANKPLSLQEKTLHIN